MKPNRFLVLAAYAVAILLIVIPLSEVTLAVWPLQPGAVSWRFAALGMGSRALMTPLLGLLLAAAIAVALNHRRVLRSLSVIAATGVLLLVVLSALFALDAVQLRAEVREDAKAPFDVAFLQALAKMGLALVTAASFAVGAWITSRGPRRPAHQQEALRPPPRPVPAPGSMSPAGATTAGPVTTTTLVETSAS